MRYLLDVNALIALGFADHGFHSRIVRWVETENFPSLLTCSITEIGFVRVLAQAPAYGYSATEAQNLLLRLKQNTRLPIEFIADGNDISSLPKWVKTPKQITDGHLAQLARENSAILATFDGRIPSVCHIP
jgi:hypothetical protein